MFIDIHAHAYRRPEPMLNGRKWFSTPDQVLERYDELNIDRGVLLPLVSPEVYLPQSNEDIFDFVQASPNRFIPFCNIDPRAISNAPEAPLADLLRYYKDRGFKGIGEVMPNLQFLDPLVQNLFRAVEEVGFPLIFDISTQIGGNYGLYDDPGLVQLEECLRRFPKLKILGHGPAFWAEIGKLRQVTDRATYPNYPVDAEGVVPRLLREYPNLYGDLSANSGFNALNRDTNYAITFLNEFQDKLLFGTDICYVGQDLPLAQFLIGLRDAGRLPNEAFIKIARKNAIEMLNLEVPSLK